MLRILLDLGLFGLLTSSVSAGLALVGLLRFRQRRSPTEHSAFSEPVSLLKPLHGAEPNLEAHLESFFQQDYPRFEILFCARSAADPGLAIARRVAARYPHIAARFLSTGEETYINAKVSSMELMAAEAAHDLFVISDSDVRVTPDYLRAVAAPFADAAVGGVTCLYRGVADQGLWAKLEAAGMSVEMTSGVLTANLLEGMKFALGPTMAFRRRSIDRMGGFGILGPYCSDDFLLGAYVAEQGETVVLSDHVIDHIILNIGFLASLQHQTRWMKSTRFSRPWGHLGTALTFSLPFGLLACAAGLGLHRPVLAVSLLAYSVVQRMVLAGFMGWAAVEDRHLLRTVALYPLRDLIGFLCWMASYAGSTILWRGRRYRLTRGGLMHPVDPQTASEASRTVVL